MVLLGSHINFSGGQHGYNGDFKYAVQTCKNELIRHREFVSYGLDVLLSLALIFECVHYSWFVVPLLLLCAVAADRGVFCFVSCFVYT